MKPQELRIGNYHLYHIEDTMDDRKEWDEVCKIDYDDLRILTEFEDNSEYKPIPLTKEWLLKFGFENWGRDDDDCVDCINYVLHNVIDGTSNFVVSKSNEGFFPSIDGTQACCWYKFESVHQLQNLYFALTGKELIL